MRRLRRMMLLVDAVRRLGPAWVLFRIRYELRRRAGRLRAASPPSGWPPVAAVGRWPSVVDRDALRAELARSISPERLAALHEHRDRLDEFTFEIFGTPTTLRGWHDDPNVEDSYSPDAHWTDVATPSGADVKRVWEASRFTWGFDLARLHLVEPEAGAADLFWRLLGDWMQHNQPNTGINWGCGQEASFRLLSVIATADAMADSLTDDRSRQVQQLAVVTAERVASNIDYARSQSNNHHASEAMGLITVGLLFPRDRRADDWLRSGEQHLAEVCESLVFDDGGTSQYSTNYHRVFLHDFIWTAQVYRAAGRPVPDWLRAALERTTRLLAAITEPISGGGPFFGPDDGARVLPLSASPHRHLADDVALAAACVGVDVDAGVEVEASSEPAAWFGLQPPPVAEPTRDRAAFVESFPDMGVHVLGCGVNRVYVRATRWQFRPGHDDQLHCDVWMDGRNVVRDPGTATYHPAPGRPGSLSGSEYHNGPRLVGRPGMVAVSTFLWAKWTQARAMSLEVVDGRAVGRFVHTIDGVEVTRLVEVGEVVEITDSCDVDFETTWLVDDEPAYAVRLGGSVDDLPGVASRGYGTSEPVTYRVARSTARAGTQWLHTVVSAASER